MPECCAVFVFFRSFWVLETLYPDLLPCWILHIMLYPDLLLCWISSFNFYTSAGLRVFVSYIRAYFLSLHSPQTNDRNSQLFLKYRVQPNLTCTPYLVKPEETAISCSSWDQSTGTITTMFWTHLSVSLKAVFFRSWVACFRLEPVGLRFL